MRKIVLLPLLLFAAQCCLSQAPEVTVRGTVTDARTGKGVKANIRYSSLPSQAINGRFNDSTFSFVIFGSANFQINASAAGCSPNTVLVRPDDNGTTKNVIRNIKLSPKGQTIVIEDLIFAQGKSVIDPKSYTGLDEVVQMMKENAEIEIQLEGHTDNIGSPKANLTLSQERVDAVKKYMVSKGISKNRIQTKAFGGTQPLDNE